MGTDLIYIQRHAEKWKRERDMGLSLVGQIHASCLVSFYRNFPLGPPKSGFAATSRTLRSVATLNPLQAELEIDILDLDIGRSPHHNAQVIRNASHFPVVVAWEHHQIVNLVHSLGYFWVQGWSFDPRRPEVDDSLYNVTWVLFNGTLRVYHHNFMVTSNGAKCQLHNFEYPYDEYRVPPPGGSPPSSRRQSSVLGSCGE